MFRYEVCPSSSIRNNFGWFLGADEVLGYKENGAIALFPPNGVPIIRFDELRIPHQMVQISGVEIVKAKITSNLLYWYIEDGELFWLDTKNRYALSLRVDSIDNENSATCTIYSRIPARAVPLCLEDVSLSFFIK